MDPGGRLLGTLVHEVLAAIPLDRADLAENFARYLAAKRGKTGSVVKRAAALVTAALRSEVVTSALGSRCWREVPFVMTGPEGLVEGSIDLVIEDTTGKMTVVDFKTDGVSAELVQELEAIYAPQLHSYVTVLKQGATGEVFSKLLFLRLL